MAKEIVNQHETLGFKLKLLITGPFIVAGLALYIFLYCIYFALGFTIREILGTQ